MVTPGALACTATSKPPCDGLTSNGLWPSRTQAMRLVVEAVDDAQGEQKSLCDRDFDRSMTPKRNERGFEKRLVVEACCDDALRTPRKPVCRCPKRTVPV